ncbi:transglutaminase domain-containing protein [Pseudoflavonifractor sp. 60]|uniref:transglutaminase-like domain-containing protein n=1 Tax=Pseudoflavonifractor sp. 60 TaxID=2304576 RepID=UPI00136D7F81|nr:transglutaminase-like domain-containing protein [Pseudoflavonifractor sp. 60]NBI65395.1 transglutaminase domain-containing protein [Pseudoflavonifractor sp. 60]
MDVNETFRSLNVGLPEDILRRKIYGDFDRAVRLIDGRLAQEGVPQGLRDCMTAQREMMLRTPPDYPFTREQALARVRSYIPDFSEEEFDQRVDAGKIGWIYLQGQPHYFARFFETMCKAEPSFARRANFQMHGVESVAGVSGKEDRLERCTRLMRERGQVSNRIQIRAALRLKDEHFIPGMFLRAHLPIPAACEQQRDIIIEKITPASGRIDPEDALQRTVCWEGEWEENPEFSVTYSYVHTARFHDLSQPGLGIQTPASEEELAQCLKEEPPHIVFTPYLRDLARELTAGKEDTLEKARSIFDFITLNMKYTFMPAYFGLENIAENCARSFTGDCGVFALLFITLCRCAGIPAQWQSGLTAEPDFCGGHDWARFYVLEYGWLYADPSYGTAAVRADKEERRKFYFGNLDPYRMVANRRFQAPFIVEKVHWRADPYDNQVGELETADRGLRYEEFDRSKAVLLHEEV